MVAKLLSFCSLPLMPNNQDGKVEREESLVAKYVLAFSRAMCRTTAKISVSDVPVGYPSRALVGEPERRSELVFH